MKLLSLLSVETGASFETLSRIIATAPKRYKVYQIPKRTGGLRTIAHPAKELKLLQRIFLHEILDKIEVSPIATAYVQGRGILKNAELHVGQRWLLKLDFKDFFPSITPRDWDRTSGRIEVLKSFNPDRKLLHKMLFWGAGAKTPECLSIGAPTSPSISNLVCIKLDEWMIQRADEKGLRVTRYADDITISGADVSSLLRFEEELHHVLKMSRTLKLDLNEKKRGIYGPGERRMVTGLILTPDGRISLGRQRKREISALIHKFAVGVADINMAMRAKGLLGFAYAVEPNFVASMTSKYGAQIISAIQKFDVELAIPIEWDL